MSDPWPGMSAGSEMLSWWNDLLFKMMNAGLSVPSDATPPDAFRKARSVMLEAWTEYWNRYLRSPEFLNPLKQMMDSNIQMRRQMGNLFGEFQHNLQNVSRQDVDQVMRSLRHLEQRLADAIDRVSDRLEDLDERLDRIEEPDEGQPAREEPAQRGNGRAPARGGRRPRRSRSK